MNVSVISIGDKPVDTATNVVYGLYSYLKELVHFK